MQFRQNFDKRPVWIPRGFTLLELVISISVLALVAVVAVIRFSGYLQHYRADAAAQQIQTDLAYARQLAISRSRSQTVRFLPASGSYSLVDVSDLDRPGQPYLIRLGEEPYQCVLVSASLGNDADLIIDRYGTPDSGGTIVVRAGKVSRTVTVNSETGAATIP